MGYRAEKLKVEKKMKILKRVLLCVVAGIALCLCVFSAFVPSATWKYYFNKPKIRTRAEGELRMHFIDVGQGDATLLELPDGKTMLIDGGSEAATATVMRYLNALKIKTIDYLTVTHTDVDHCGGLDSVVKYKDVRAAYLPDASAEENTQYAQLYAALNERGCAKTLSSRSVEIRGDGYRFSFLYPYTSELGDGEYRSNADSSVLWLDYNGVNALFMGDAPMETENLLLRDSELGMFEKRQTDLHSVEILKVAHHGSAYSCGEEFLSYIGVQTAIVSCGKNNIYKHPSEETLERLRNANAEIYRTDESGHIILTIGVDGRYTVETVET